MSVILNEVKNLVESMGWKTEILRLMPQNDITTQSQRGRRGGFELFVSLAVCHLNRFNILDWGSDDLRQ